MSHKLTAQAIMLAVPAMVEQANIEFFIGAIDTTELEYYILNRKESKQVFAYCDGDSIGFSPFFCRDIELLYVTVAHELIHVWQDQNGYKLTHGRIFKSHARRICNLTGWNFKEF